MNTVYSHMIKRFFFLLTFTTMFSLLSADIAHARTPIHLGIDVLEEAQFQPLAHKRVGLLTHPAGVNRLGISTIQVLHRSPYVHLVALFGPEHGIYGDEKANVPVDNRIDPKTNLPVYSLYGKYRKPTAAMLHNIDILVIDLQGLGVRSYTYISCMRYAMEACFENGVEVIVLDRPNPLGGQKVDGPSMDEKWMSYVGAYPIPYVYGLTIGELARMAKNTPGWLKIEEHHRTQGKLLIIPMRGWERGMLWPDTGLPWVATSPAIQDLSAAMGYAMTGLGAQLGNFSHGYGTPWAFRLLTYQGKPAKDVYSSLKSRSIPGLDFKLIRYHNHSGAEREGVYTIVTDWEKLRPTEVSFHMMQLSAAWSDQNPFTQASQAKARLFNKHVGSTDWWHAITQWGGNIKLHLFLELWEEESQRFKYASSRFYIYP